MKRVGLIVLVLSGCAGLPTALNQAPMLVPEIEPAPSFPAPGYTPAGAGASPLGMPWTRETPVERSPNKRILPVDPTDPAPGLWAADEAEVKASAAVGPPVVAGVELPVPEADDLSKLQARVCEYRVSRLLRSEGQMSQLMKLRLVDRQCVVAQLNEFCWREDMKKIEDAELRKRRELAAEDIHGFTLWACRDTSPDKRKVENIRKAVTSVWESAFKNKERRRR